MNDCTYIHTHSLWHIVVHAMIVPISCDVLFQKEIEKNQGMYEKSAAAGSKVLVSMPLSLFLLLFSSVVSDLLIEYANNGEDQITIMSIIS